MSKPQPSSSPTAPLAKGWINEAIEGMLAEAKEWQKSVENMGERADIACIVKIQRFCLEVRENGCEAVALECLRPHTGRRPHKGQSVAHFAAMAICGKYGATATRYARVVRWLMKTGCTPEDAKDAIAECGGSKKCAATAAAELAEPGQRQKELKLPITLTKEAKADLRKGVSSTAETLFWGVAKKSGDKIEIVYAVFGRPPKGNKKAPRPSMLK